MNLNYKRKLVKKKVANFASLANSDNSIDLNKRDTFLNTCDFDNLTLKDAPLLQNEIFDELPELLKRCCQPFKDKRERDIVLLSSICVLSGVFNNVEGFYNGDNIYPPLNLFVLAPASSGKGVMKNAKKLGQAVHLDKRKCVTFNEDKESIKQHLFIPANISSTALYESLSVNDGSGIMFETEADTLISATSQDWGNFTDVIRKSFHFETVSLKRVGSAKYIEVDNPKLSVILSGTVSQFVNLLKSAENGLFSRFIYYGFHPDMVWKDVVGKINGVNLEEHFKKLSEEVLGINNELIDLGKVNFKIQSVLFDMFNNNFREYHKIGTKFCSNDIQSIVVRLGHVCMRIAMVLTILRYYENSKPLKNVELLEGDLNISLKIIETLLIHSLIAFRILPHSSVFDGLPSGVKKFYDLIDENRIMQRKELVTLGVNNSISEKSVDNYLKKLKEIGLLLEPEGKYGCILKP